MWGTAPRQMGKASSAVQLQEASGLPVSCRLEANDFGLTRDKEHSSLFKRRSCVPETQMTIALLAGADDFSARMLCFVLGHQIKIQCAEKLGNEKSQRKGITSA